MRAGWLVLGLTLLFTAEVDGQDRKFPYAAVIDVDEEVVRCGPGPKYYVTSKLRRGDSVVVHRHDPGGWYMIAPPEGNFSWIQAEYVQRLASGRGQLTANNVIAHVGSAVGDDRGVYQRTLSKGDTVEILSEETISTERGPVSMYKIKPPPREYRWISGKALKPSDGKPGGNGSRGVAPSIPAPSIKAPIALDFDLETSENDPFKDGPAAVSPLGSMPKEVEPGDPTRVIELPPALGDANVAENNAALEPLRKKLEELDVQFRSTLQSDPLGWNLPAIESQYKELDQTANHPAFAAHVAQRLATLNRYAKLQQEYQEFHQLTAVTRDRDARLVALQRQNEAKLDQLAAAANNPAQPAAGNPAMAANPAPGTVTPGQVASTTEPNANGPSLTPPGVPSPPGTDVPSNPASLSTAQPRRPSKFDGAGIVQRVPPNVQAPLPYVLVAPNGRFLAYLEAAPGVDLANVSNQAVGVFGQRTFRPELKADVITVRSWQPVVLQTRQ